MRAIILLGAMLITASINQGYMDSKIPILAVILIAALFIDAIEFNRNSK